MTLPRLLLEPWYTFRILLPKKRSPWGSAYICTAARRKVPGSVTCSLVEGLRPLPAESHLRGPTIISQKRLLWSLILISSPKIPPIPLSQFHTDTYDSNFNLSESSPNFSTPIVHLKDRQDNIHYPTSTSKMEASYLPSNPKMTRACSFLNLPYEIRLKIYKFSGLVRPCPIDLAWKPFGRTGPSQNRPSSYECYWRLRKRGITRFGKVNQEGRECFCPSLPVQLLSVSRAVNEDVVPIF